MAEIVDGISYESLWHTSAEFRNCSNKKKEIIATNLQIIYRREYQKSAPYINKEEGKKHGFPQGYLGYPEGFVAKNIRNFL
tara:strand:- start:642 stop:884 length:243 start_codon:yes stop_codon:yes gene_type:complete